jgi:hypothetical protein
MSTRAICHNANDETYYSAMVSPYGVLTSLGGPAQLND